ncbi:RAD23 homolog A, nucleotide excision repair protein a isoform X2 [Ictalurus punctatus]|uniref:RAD23 homolog A, nucleotide excision repair protein a isoform X2 n=2 Tax=Ictalurus punctatus TaxID=7998 RepID=A0A9F7TGH5_ICTPU|nr:RAD23 homolog A, nucleotide excision repair protein a isoform X2 [Ictalurus punctatus]
MSSRDREGQTHQHHHHHHHHQEEQQQIYGCTRTTHADEKFVDVMGSMVESPPSLPPSSSSSDYCPPPPPRPAPAAMPFTPGNCSEDPPASQQQPDNTAGAPSDGAIENTPIQEVSGAPTQETCTDEAEKLNEPVQESRDGEGAGHEEAEQGDAACAGGKGEPDVTAQ